MTGESKKTTMTIPHQNPASTSANNPSKPLKRILKHHKSSYRPKIGTQLWYVGQDSNP